MIVSRQTLIYACLAAGLPFTDGSPPPAARFACADSARARLGHYLGTWSVQAVFEHEGRAAEVWPGEAIIEPDLGGCVLVEHLRTRRDSLPFEVLAVWGAQGSGAAFQRMMTHSQHGLLGLYEGSAAGHELLLEYTGTLPDPAGRLRHVIRPRGAHGFTFESQRSAPGDTAWRVTWRAEYRRKDAS